jgi:PAS domain S-box-containing protein
VDKTPTPPDRPRGATGPRDLALTGGVVALLFAAGTWTGAFARVGAGLRDSPFLGEMLALAVLTIVGTAFVSIRRARQAAREVSLRLGVEARFKALVEESPSIVYTWDAVHHRHVYVSPQVEPILGYTPEEWGDGERWLSAIHPEDVDEVRRRSAAADAGGAQFLAEYRVLTKDGRTRWVRDESRNVQFDAAGAPAIAQGVISDITAQREADARALEAEARFRILVERVPAVSYVWDGAVRPGEGPAAYISPQVEHLLGYSADDWLAQPEAWARAVHPDDLEPTLAAWDRAVAAGTPFSAEYRIVRADGEVVWIRDEANPVGDGTDGRPVYQGVMFDVTERRLAERRLRDSEERWRLLLEHLPVTAYMIEYEATEGGAIVDRWIGPGITALLGHTPEEWTADPDAWAHALHPDDREMTTAAWRRSVDTPEGRFEAEYRMVHRDGRVVWVHEEAASVTRDGRIRAEGVFIDITARRNAEAALLDAEERLRSLVEQLPVAVYTDAVDDLSTALYISPRYEELTGYSPSERLQDPELWVRMLHPEDRERVLAESARTNEDGSDFDIEYRIIRADGATAWLHDHAVLVHDAKGNRIWQGVLQDVTDRHVAQEALREAEERYRGIVEHVPAAIYLDKADASMESVYMSPQIEQIAGVTAQEWLAEPELWLDLMDPEDRDRVRASYLLAARQQEPWQAEYRLRTPDGRTIWIHDETTFLHDANGDPRYLQGVVMDITERKLAEQALRESERREREAAERLRALDDMKNTFLAAVSHELRSPLTSILGLSLTLDRAPDIPLEDRRDLLGRLAANARKLDRLLRDLLDIDRLNRGIVSPQRRDSDVGQIARRTVEQLDLAGRDVVVEADPVVLPVDPAKVERIIENLLMNAVRHTTEDRRIWLRIEEAEAGAFIVVEDNGPGVPDEIRSAIFEPFRQGPTASPHSPGTGIGLSLVARFAELHGGRAWVEDRPGGGASFRVFLPAIPLEPHDDVLAPLDAGIGSAAG